MKAIDKTTVAQFLSKYISQLTVQDIEVLIEIPPTEIDYTYAFPCFRLAKIEKKAPKIIAKELKKKIKLPDFLENLCQNDK